jgi:hypothetical protein
VPRAHVAPRRAAIFRSTAHGQWALAPNETAVRQGGVTPRSCAVVRTTAWWAPTRRDTRRHDGTRRRVISPSTTSDRVSQEDAMTPTVRMRTRLIAVVCAVLGACGLARAQSLDTSFNPGANSSVLAVATQADGKILVGGGSDVDGDGRLDLLWRNTATGRNILWYLNNAT